MDSNDFKDDLKETNDKNIITINIGRDNTNNVNTKTDNKTDDKKTKDEPARRISLSKASNLWQAFLQDASINNKRQTKEGHLIVFGGANAGKTSLVTQFRKLETRAGEMKRFLMMRYAYVDLTDANTDEPHALLNIWQITEPSHCKILDVVIAPEHMAYVAYMICLDVSDPSTVKEQMDLWTEVLENTQKRLLERLEPSKQAELKLKLSKHMQFYVNPNDAESEPLTSEEKESIKIDSNIPEANLGCPIILVATKCDAFSKLFVAEADAEDRFDILVGYLRWWALKYGAASFSMASTLKEQARRILHYIDYRLFDIPFNRGPSAIVKLSNLNEKFLFIPSGFDSKDIIQSQHANRSFQEPFQALFPPKQQIQHASDDKVMLKSSEDVTFLKTLEFEIQQIEKQRGSSQETSSSATTSMNTKRGDDLTQAFGKLVQAVQTQAKKTEQTQP